MLLFILCVIMSVTWQKLPLCYEKITLCQQIIQLFKQFICCFCDICLKVLVHVGQFLFVILVLNRDQSMHN